MPVRPPRRVGRRVAKISLVALASLILLAGLVLGGVALVLTPARLTPLVNEYASRVLNARIGFDTVSLSLVRHFPNVGVRLKGGQIVSRAFEDLPDSLRAEIPAAADTLLRFDEICPSCSLRAWSSAGSICAVPAFMPMWPHRGGRTGKSMRPIRFPPKAIRFPLPTFICTSPA